MTPADARRPPPVSSARRGWCPGLTRMMPTGDGLLARIHPPLGVLIPKQARTVAEGARRFGNGHIDLTARANLQIRGVNEADAGALARLIEAAGLGDVRGDGGPQRVTLTSPLAGRDPAEVIDVPALARAIEAAGRATVDLPAKTLVAIEGRIGIAGPDADFSVTALMPGWVGISVATECDWLDLLACCVDEAPSALARFLAAFARSGRRRTRDLSPAGREILVDIGRAASAAPLRLPPGVGWPIVSAHREGGTIPPGILPTTPRAGVGPLAPGLWTLVLDAPFGRCTAEALARVADAADAIGAEEIRLSPKRGLILLARDGGRATDALAGFADAFIVAPGDPRRDVAVCTGAPACASGSTPTLTDAGRIAAVLRGVDETPAIHVSGCAKGCARPGPADLTLVARDGAYGVVVAGGPGDQPSLRLPIEAALERLGRAGALGLAAAFAADAAAAGRGREERPA